MFGVDAFIVNVAIPLPSNCIGAVRAVDYDQCRISVMDAPRTLRPIVTMPLQNPRGKILRERQYTVFLFCSAAIIWSW